MTPEKKVSKHDARLCKAAIDLAHGFVEAEVSPEGSRNEKTPEADYNRAVGGCLGAIREEIDVGKRDIAGVFRVARKARALKLRNENEKS